MRRIALAGLAALLVTAVTRADEPKAPRFAPSKRRSPMIKVGGPKGRSPSSMQQIRAEFEAQQAAFRQAATKCREHRATSGRSPEKQAPDLVVTTVAGWWTWPSRPRATRRPGTPCSG